MHKPNPLKTLALVSLLTLAGPALAADPHAGHDMSGASGHAGHSMPAASPPAADPHAGHQMDQGGRMGDKAQESKVEGYTFSYHMIDNLARIKASGQNVDLSQVKSNHLMVYVAAPDGKPVDKAQVGYLIKNPDGSEQKAMAMAMGGGFGADVSLAAPGKYTIKTKVVAGEKTLLDEFPYERK